MKAKKIVRYRISVSVNFPQTHARKGENTDFVGKICRNLEDELVEKHGKHALIGIKDQYSIPGWYKLEPKIHTCRANFPLWQKRFEKIAKGEAVIELYYWTGKPYNSKTVTICQLGKDDGIGLQKLEFLDHRQHGTRYPFVQDRQPFSRERLAKNDGLSLIDFKEWFKCYDLSEPMAIIHFTSFRY